MQVFGDETRLARREHRCSYCDGAIRKGSTYRRWASEDGGQVCTVRAHPDCVALWRVVQPYEDEIPLDPYEFRQDCYAYGGPGPFPWEGG